MIFKFCKTILEWSVGSFLAFKTRYDNKFRVFTTSVGEHSIILAYLMYVNHTRGENVSLRVCKLVGKSVENSWLARVCQICTHANSQLAYCVQTCCKSGGCQLGKGTNLCKSVGKFENLQKFASHANPLKTLSLRFVCIQRKLLESV